MNRLPFHVWRGGAQPLVQWAPLDACTFAEPFFDQTITAALHTPLTLLVQHTTTLAELLAAAAERPPVRPDGIIFHVSRCGSTLVAQMLARLDGARVLAEPQPVTRFLEDPRLAPEERVAALRAFVTLLAPPVRASGRRGAYVLKLDPRNTLDWATVRAAFPDTPILLVHRDPLEVLVSNLNSMPAALLPGEIATAKLGPPPAETLATGEDYAAFALSRIFAAAAELAAEPGVLPLDYAELPAAVEARVLPAFGLAPRPAADDLAALRAAAGVYAKDASRTVPFRPDGAAKRAEATDEIRARCAQWLEPAVARLRARTAARAPT